MKKLFLIIFILICSTSLNAKTFKEVLHLYEFQIKTYLKKHNITNISQITPININKEYKTGFWPNHWPFAVGISENKAFWITFKRLSMVEINPISTLTFKQLSSINGNNDGKIMIADQGQNKVFVLQLDKTLTHAKPIQTIPVNAPKVIRISKSNSMMVIGKTQLYFFEEHKHSYKLNKQLTRQLNSKVDINQINDIQFDSKNYLYILLEKEIIVFNKTAQKIKTIKLDKQLTEFGISHHKNIIGISSLKNSIYLFSQKGKLLKEKPFPSFKNKNKINFSYFPPFAYVGLYSDLEGYAYNMGLELINFKWKKNNTIDKEFSFTSTFPAKTSAYITNKNNEVIKSIIDKIVLPAKQHTFKLNLVSSITPQKYTLTITGKALYSQSNTKTLSIAFEH